MNKPIDFDKAVLEFEGAEDLVLELLQEFLQDIYSQRKLMEEALVKGDNEVIRKNAHSIKGGALNVCALPLSEAASSLEKLASTETSAEEVQKGLTRLVDEAKQLSSFLENLIASKK